MTAPHTKDQTLKQSLIAYLQNSPDERLWQAIRNWSGHQEILIKDKDQPPVDSFFWENRK